MPSEDRRPEEPESRGDLGNVVRESAQAQRHASHRGCALRGAAFVGTVCGGPTRSPRPNCQVLQDTSVHDTHCVLPVFGQKRGSERSRSLRPSIAAVPNPLAGGPTSPWPVRNRVAQQEVNSERAKLHLGLSLPPEPYPTARHRSVENLSSTKPVPGAKKVRDRCSRG